MDKPEVAYELHDSTIVAVSIGPRREAMFTIDLYPIYYSNKPRVRLRFGGIDNLDEVMQYVDEIRQEAGAVYIGCRIDAFHYDIKKESKIGDYWFLLQTDWCGPLRIHCSSMSMIELESPSS